MLDKMTGGTIPYKGDEAVEKKSDACSKALS